MLRKRNTDEALRERIRAQRALYAEALDAGYSVADASLIAVGRKTFDRERAVPAEPFEKNALVDFLPAEEEATETTRPAAVTSTAGPAAETTEPDPRDAIVIPDDWRTAWKWNDLRKFAAVFSPTTVSNRDECERAIEAELARRAAR